MPVLPDEIPFFGGNMSNLGSEVNLFCVICGLYSI